MRRFSVLSWVPLGFLLLCLVGCGSGKVHVTGKVTFPDGTPLATGSVAFHSPGYVVYGDIKSDGTYNVGELKDGDGIKPGSYTVSVRATAPEPKTGHPVSIVDESFSLPCEVEKTMRFDIEVPRAKSR